MKPETKIATCCYCGTRAALVLTVQGRHELSCSGCGAPLHEMKMLRQEAPAARKPAKRVSALPRDLPVQTKGKKKKKKRKSMFSRLLDEAWDAVEDIID